MTMRHQTPLEQAREAARILQQAGVKPEYPHFHVGENGTRCEFCNQPLWKNRHDPMNVLAGKIIRREFNCGPDSD